MLDFSRRLTVSSKLRYAKWKLAKEATPVALTLQNGVTFWLRRDTSENNDYGIAYEVFVHDYYKPVPELDRDKVRVVFDLGGNVGMTVLHWLAAFPRCTVETFEPNPLHVAQMRRNIAVCGHADRVTLHPKAAGARPRVVRFSNLGTSSSALHTAEDWFDADMVDAFAHLSGKHIDLLKIDIEGGEYELMGDPRFADLDVGAIVMEWHDRGNGDADRQWCETRLTDMGFSIRTLFREKDHGMFWALRP